MKPEVRPILPNPDALVSGGRFSLGCYCKPLQVVNPLDVAFSWPVPRLIKNLRLKEWQHFALVCDKAYISLALFNGKTVALAQVCIYQRQTGQIHFYERMPMPWSFRIPETLWNSEVEYQSTGFRLGMKNRLDEGYFEIEFELDSSKDLPAAQGRFYCLTDAKKDEPLVVCLPLSGVRAMYSHKHITPMKGSLSLGQSVIEFNEEKSYGLIDVHKGYYPYLMKWHWATGGGHDAKRRLVGFNLTDNQVQDQENYNENCVWLDGSLQLLPPVKFSFRKEAPREPWTIRDSQGMVDLKFIPEVVRTVDKDFVVLKSRYRGPFGNFTGRLRLPSGEEVSVQDQFGMCEDFYLRA